MGKKAKLKAPREDHVSAPDDAVFVSFRTTKRQRLEIKLAALQQGKSVARYLLDAHRLSMKASKGRPSDWVRFITGR